MDVAFNERFRDPDFRQSIRKVSRKSSIAREDDEAVSHTNKQNVGFPSPYLFSGDAPDIDTIDVRYHEFPVGFGEDPSLPSLGETTEVDCASRSGIPSGNGPVSNDGDNIIIASQVRRIFD